MVGHSTNIFLHIPHGMLQGL